MDDRNPNQTTDDATGRSAVLQRIISRLARMNEADLLTVERQLAATHFIDCACAFCIPKASGKAATKPVQIKQELILIYDKVADAFVGTCGQCNGRYELDRASEALTVDDCGASIELFGDGSIADPYGVGILH